MTQVTFTACHYHWLTWAVRIRNYWAMAMTVPPKLGVQQGILGYVLNSIRAALAYGLACLPIKIWHLETTQTIVWIYRVLCLVQSLSKPPIISGTQNNTLMTYFNYPSCPSNSTRIFIDIDFQFHLL